MLKICTDPYIAFLFSEQSRKAGSEFWDQLLNNPTRNRTKCHDELRLENCDLNGIKNKLVLMVLLGSAYQPT